MDVQPVSLSDFTKKERFLLKKALSKLSAHDDTPLRLCEKLSKLTYQGEAAGEDAAWHVVEFLCENGLLNESRYAENLLSALMHRGYGARRILQEFRARRFSAQSLEWLSQTLAEREEESMESAFGMLSRRARARRSDLSDPAEVKKLFGYLMRLGYDATVCREAIRQLKEEEQT